jgi:hypothetical protein
LTNQFGKNRNLAKLTSPQRKTRTLILVGIDVSHEQVRAEGEKEIKDREGSLMQVFKSYNDINIILFFSQGS